MGRSAMVIAMLGTLGACQRQPEQQRQPVRKQDQSQTPTASATQPDGKASLEEAPDAIDPKSAEAAAQVVQDYEALIEQKRWAEANALWSDRSAAARFGAALAQYREAHLETGNPGEPEGAAGSIYVTVPAILYGDGKDGQPFRRSADATLRRVNDIPGSTDAQRRWHIERIDLAD